MELYVHIPFCRSKCAYCDFASWAGQDDLMPAYVDAVLGEAMRRARETGSPVIDTVYIGGGTPSILPPHLLERLIGGLKMMFPFAHDVEFSSEANPGTLTPVWLETAVSCGINRISMGVQAMQPELLRTLGRIHTWEQAAVSAELIRQAGITNFSADLMFGLPGQTREQWRDSLEAVLSLGVQHMSCYGLIPEEGTLMNERLEKGELRLPDEELERMMYDDAIELLASHGLAQYEISNFAVPGKECRHNIGYWQQVPYIGLGASAASMLRTDDGFFSVRSTNPRTIRNYIRMVDEQAWDLRETEHISYADARFETIMLALRMNKGVS